MRPEDLKSPFTWNKRQVLVQDRVWCVPGQFTDFSSFKFPGWHHPIFFDREQPVCIEYCTGNGAWIAAKAQEQSQYNWVGIERKFDRVRRIWCKGKNFTLSNLLAVCGEGLTVTQQYIPSESVHSVFINFPDPWPKNRHAKHRIIQEPFIREMIRILQSKGTLTIVTDDHAFSQWTIDILGRFPEFMSEFKDPYYVLDYPSYGTSYFEDLWRQKGKDIYYHVFRKCAIIS